MISIISMLSSPNDESPANVDAAKEWREDRVGPVSFQAILCACCLGDQELSSKHKMYF